MFRSKLSHHPLMPFPLAVLVLGALATPAPGLAQLAPGPPAWATGGYGGAAQIASQPMSASTRDSGDNRVILNGEMLAPGSNSVTSQYSLLSGGASTSGTGAGYGSATAIGNLLNVTIEGSGNTVIVNSQQSSSGGVTATVTSPPK